MRGVQRRQLGLVSAAGVVLGLAMITKNVYAMLMPPVWLMFWVVDRRFYRRQRHAHTLLPPLIGLACVAAWYGYQMLSLGQGSLQQGASTIDNLAANSIYVIAPSRMLASLKFVLGPNNYMALGVPGLVYGLVLAIRGRRSLRNLQQLLFLVTIGVWLAWYVVASIGWQRYALPALVLMAPFAARLILDLGAHVVDLIRARLGREGRFLSVLGLAVLLGLFCLFPLFRTSFYEETSSMFGERDLAVQRLADYLIAHVPSDSVIESWAWEVDFFTDHTYHHPPHSLVSPMIRHVYLGEPIAPDAYEFEQHHPDYVIDDAFTKWTGLYPSEYLERECILVGSFGAYDLYRTKPKGVEP
jgi:hypothetical protein